ncbi:MAG TPA: ferritin family protein [Thermoanaerobaculia bacterium]|nr:ferritin family protein [Thermoanaerobaculia bacterium]
MKPLDTNPEEVLRKAIQDEITTHEFYQRLSERVEVAEAKKKLLDLAELQLVHRARLERRYREVIGRQPPDPEVPRVDIPLDAHEYDLHRVLKLALEHERDSESNYRFLAERVPDTELGSLFLELAEMEWKHKTDIQNEYNAMLDPEQFLLDMD